MFPEIFWNDPSLGEHIRGRPNPQSRMGPWTTQRNPCRKGGIFRVFLSFLSWGLRFGICEPYYCL
jgi:hypothetical protein